MATTTNYGWTTPDDTALVKDGASAIRTLGTAIDTTTFNNASAAIAKTIVDAKGDIIAATAADTVARLAVGTNGQLLSADSTAATGLAWTAAPTSGGMTLISTTTLTGASITLSSIPQTYNSLYFVIRNYKPATDDSRIFLRANSDAGASRYKINTTTVVDPATFDSAQWDLGVGNDNSVANALTTFTIPDYFNTTTWKNIFGYVTTTDNTTTTSFAYMNFTGSYNQTAAISSMLMLPNSGNFTSGEVLLYGVK